MDVNMNKPQETVKDREAWRVAVLGVEKSQTWLSDWTALPGSGIRQHSSEFCTFTTHSWTLRKS